MSYILGACCLVLFVLWRRAKAAYDRETDAYVDLATAALEGRFALLRQWGKAERDAIRTNQKLAVARATIKHVASGELP